MKKVLIIAYYFPPLGWSGVQRTLKFVKYLRNFGWEPIVVTVGKTKFSILDETLIDEIPKDIEIINIDDIKFKDVTDKMKSQLKFYVSQSLDIISNEKLKQLYEEEIEKKFSELRGLLLLPDGNAVWANNVIKEIQQKVNFSEIDVVYSTSAPYSTHLIGNYIKKEFNIPWVSDFRDQWINNPYSAFDKNSLRYKLENNIEESIILNCDRVITTTSISRKNYVNSYNLDSRKISTITNGYDEEDFKNIYLEKVNKEKFRIIHNGSFYLKRNPYTFTMAIKNLLKDKLVDKLNIEIILNGQNDSSIIEKSMSILGEDKDILICNGYLPHDQSLSYSQEADILLLVCGNEESSKEVYTGKVFEYLRLKRPIMAISPKESLVEELLEETKCGVNVEYNNVEKIQEVILYYYNKWLKNEAVEIEAKNIEKYERKVLTKKLADIFSEIS